MTRDLSRRHWLVSALAAPGLAATTPNAKLPVCAFSKHFQWTGVKEAAQLAASIGYDALDLTVRKDGHVEPERVADDLPKAVEHIRAAGLTAPMITAGIIDISSPHAEAILRTAKSLGIQRYRWGGFRYDTSKTIPQQIAELRAKAKDLAAMNRTHGMCAMYHTHSGTGQFGASMWDIWEVLRDLDNNSVSVNLDIGHATVEGGAGGWINTTRLLGPMIRGVAVKDFRWERNAQGKWFIRWCGFGDGMVNFRGFLSMLREMRFEGPLQLHMEYDELGGADSGKRSMSISREEFFRMMKRDLDRFRGLLRETGLL